MKAIILAAGEGKRMNSSLPKVLHKVCGKKILDYVINLCEDAGINEIILVLGHEADLIKKYVCEANFKANIKFVLQEKQLGTGHAVMMAKDFIDDNDKILVLYGDTPLINSETIKKLIDLNQKNNDVVSLISCLVNDPKGYGRILRRDNKFLRIIEDKDCDNNQALIKEINTGIYLFDGNLLKTALQMLDNNNSQKEYYLTDTLEIIKSISDNIGIFCSDEPEEFLGVNNKIQLAQANFFMQKIINQKHMLNGVIILEPNMTFIENNIKIGRDTIIYPNVFLENKTKIGMNCIIGPNTRISNSEIFDDVKIEYSIILDSIIKNNTRVGPFAYIRPNCIINENIKIGDFVEIKNSNIDTGTKISHLTYIGDADVGKNINFGCGTTTANYDGEKKFRTRIQDNSFIGCNTNLIAPVDIGKNSYIAAGSTITKNVPDNNFAIARERQINKSDWHKNKKNNS